MKTDLQKFKEFFNEMNINYHIYTDEDESYMWIDDAYIAPNYCALLKIIFNSDGKFVEFETWGE
jgi:hypothetical protein